MELVLTVVSVPLMLALHWLYTLHRNRAELTVAQARCAQSLNKLRSSTTLPEGHFLVEALRWTQMPLMSPESDGLLAALVERQARGEQLAGGAGVLTGIYAEAGGHLLEWCHAALAQLRQLAGPMRLAGASAKQAVLVLGLLGRLEQVFRQPERLAAV